MCFSAQASFFAGFGLLASSFYFLKKQVASEYKLLKLVPVFFGIQQLCEGVVWITQLDSNYRIIALVARSAFLFFAFFLWPSYIPRALLPLATTELYKSIQTFLYGMGVTVGSLLAWLSFKNGISCLISCHHIEYFFTTPSTVSLPLVFFYCITTVISFFLTGRKNIAKCGILMAVSVLISAYFYTMWFTSVWCFFAALLSWYIFLL